MDDAYGEETLGRERPRDLARKRIGFFCPGDSGHLNPNTAFARELQARGHEVLFYQTVDSVEYVAGLGFECRVYGESVFPAGEWRAFQDKVGSLTGISALLYISEVNQKRIACGLDELPTMIERDALDLVVCDLWCPDAGAIAEAQGRPYLTMTSSLLPNERIEAPPYVSPLPYHDSAPARALNWLAYKLINLASRSRVSTLNRYRVEHGLEAQHPGWLGVSPWGQIAQITESFDFPWVNRPPTLHYVGPLADPGTRPRIPFPEEKLDGRPLIYVSMGSLWHARSHIYRVIAEACEGLDAQLMMSLGGGTLPDGHDSLPGEPLVERYVDQLEALKRARLFVNHAGMNGVNESLACGVPMVCIPMAGDHPGISSRVIWSGVGERLAPWSKTPRLRQLIETVMGEPSYREKAQGYQREIAQLDGKARAADIAETLLRTGEPVRSDSHV